MAQQKKVKEWFMNPSKFRRDIEAEQRKHPSKCIYHMSKSHTTDDCSVKKDCDKQVADRKPNISSSIPNTGVSGHLRHMKDDIFEDAVSDDVADDVLIDSPNDTNEDELLYFARVTNHYLRIVKSMSPIPVVSRHDMQYPIIADSGANYHMFKNREFFETLHPASGNVFLGDGKTVLAIKGIGTVKCRIGDHILQIEDVRYIPDLAESIYSLFLHIQCPGHYILLLRTVSLFVSLLFKRRLFLEQTMFIWMQFLCFNQCYLTLIYLTSLL
jgi:hypothetical protein